MSFTISNKEFNGVIEKQEWMHLKIAFKQHTYNIEEVQFLKDLGIIFNMLIIGVLQSDFIPEAYAIEEDN